MGGERNPAIDKYGGGAPPANPYFREGVFRSALRYGFDIISRVGSYFAEPGGRYRLAYQPISLPLLYNRKVYRRQ